MKLAQLVRVLDPDASGAESVPVEVPLDVAPDPAGAPLEGIADPGFALLVGLFDVLIEEALAALPDEDARQRALAGALGEVEGLAAVMRFELHGLRERLRQDELAARVREREIAMTEGWLLPRLRDDVAAYEARLGALRAALREP